MGRLVKWCSIYMNLKRNHHKWFWFRAQIRQIERHLTKTRSVKFQSDISSRTAVRFQTTSPQFGRQCVCFLPRRNNFSSRQQFLCERSFLWCVSQLCSSSDWTSSGRKTCGWRRLQPALHSDPCAKTQRLAGSLSSWNVKNLKPSWCTVLSVEVSLFTLWQNVWTTQNVFFSLQNQLGTVFVRCKSFLHVSRVGAWSPGAWVHHWSFRHEMKENSRVHLHVFVGEKQEIWMLPMFPPTQVEVEPVSVHEPVGFVQL